jgi:hypothetical protein
MAVSNTLAYYHMATILSVKVFIVQAQLGLNGKTFYTPVLQNITQSKFTLVWLIVCPRMSK